MKQELEQQIIEEEIQANLSFEEICPDWNDILAQNGGFVESKNAQFKTDGEQRTVMDCASCLVGEAHA